jgi:hypothetical protein
MSERIPSPEFSAEELAVIDRMKTDPRAPETLASFQAWHDREAQRLKDEHAPSRGNIEFGLKRARMYLAAGSEFYESAWTELADTESQARQEGASDLAETAAGLLRELDDLIDKGRP